MSSITSFKVGDIIVAIDDHYSITSLTHKFEGRIIKLEGDLMKVITTSSSRREEVGEIFTFGASKWWEHFAHSKSNNFKTIYDILNDEL